MNLDLITFYLYVRELRDLLVGSPLQKIFQAGEGEFVFRLRMPGENYFLFVSLEPGNERLHPIPHKFTQGVLPTPFCMSLRKHLEGGKVHRVAVFNNDRVLHIHFKRGEEDRILVVELTGRNANLFILDGMYRYIIAYNRKDPHRAIIAGQKYEAPPTSQGHNPLTVSIDEFRNILNQLPRDASIMAYMGWSFPGMPKEYLQEILTTAGIGAEVPALALNEAQKMAILEAWDGFFERIAERKLDPTLYYKKDDPEMESRPNRWAPWGFESLKQFPREKVPTIGAMLQAYYFVTTSTRTNEELKKELITAVKRRMKKVEQRILKQEKDLKGTERADTLKRWGDLLLASRHLFTEKMDRVEIEDYYQDPPQKVVIPLDPSLTVSDNAQEIYKKFKKAKRGQEIVKERLRMSQDDLQYLEELLYEIESAETADEVEDIAATLDAEGIYTLPVKPGAKKTEEAAGPRKYVLDSGYVALVGRNSKQNEELSVRIAQKEDLWFHARQIPGSHVILRIQKPSLPVPDKVIHQAAQLAAFYSKGRTGSKVPVDYTRIKNVRKVKGQKVGQVFYTHEKTIMVKPEVPGKPG